MKRKDITTLQDKTNGELEQQLQELRKGLAKAKLELSAGKLEDIRLPGKIRDDIARVKTIISQKQLSVQESVAKENK